ncbi:hypothetical protein WH47_08479, partial [Habropoda laboriosa]
RALTQQKGCVLGIAARIVDPARGPCGVLWAPSLGPFSANGAAESQVFISSAAFEAPSNRDTRIHHRPPSLALPSSPLHLHPPPHDFRPLSPYLLTSSLFISSSTRPFIYFFRALRPLYQRPPSLLTSSPAFRLQRLSPWLEEHESG